MNRVLCAVAAIFFAHFSTAIANESVLVYHSYQTGNAEVYRSALNGQDVVQLTSDAGFDGNPRLSPNGTKIAFFSNRSGTVELYTMDVDGQNQTRLTFDGAGGGHNIFGSAAWSPDGTQIIYNHGGEVRRINVDGTGQTTLCSTPYGNGVHTVDWSPTNDRIAFWGQGGWGYDNQLYTANVDGLDIQLLVPDRSGTEMGVRFSPNGLQVAYSWDPSGHEEGSGSSLDQRIYVRNADGTGGETDLSIGKPVGYNEFPTAWSADGSRILFNMGPNDSYAPEAWMMDITGANRTMLVANCDYPDWGTQPGVEIVNLLVYHSYQTGNAEVYRSGLNGQDVVQLTSEAGFDGNPRLSPNGNKIAYFSNRSGTVELYTMDVDGQNQTRLTFDGAGGGHNIFGSAAWSPDGTQIIYNHGGEVRRINVDGTGQTTLCSTPYGNGVHTVDWSPTNDRIAFWGQGGWGYSNQLYTANIDGSNIQLLVPNRAGTEIGVRFSPDGLQVAYSWDVSGHEEGSGRALDQRIYVRNADGTGGETDLSIGKPVGYNEFPTAWSADGSRILFNMGPNDSYAPEAWMMDITGANRTMLVANCDYPDWGTQPAMAPGCYGFENSSFLGWTLYGSPLPVHVPEFNGRSGLFDNNGDPSNNSGAISTAQYDLSQGFEIESEVYLDFSNSGGCWADCGIGVANPEYQSWGGYDSYLHFALAAVGDACWATPEERRGHAYLYAFWLTDCGWTNFGYVDGPGPVFEVDSLANGWHTLKVIVDGETWLPNFYVDNRLFYQGDAPVASSVMTQSHPLWLGQRSSGSAGKAYHNGICFSEGASHGMVPQPDSLVIQVIGNDVHLDWTPSLTCHDSIISYAIFYETDSEADFEFLALTSSTAFVHEHVVQFESSMYYEVAAYYLPLNQLRSLISSFGKTPRRSDLDAMVKSISVFSTERN